MIFIIESWIFILWVFCGFVLAYVGKNRGAKFWIWLMYGLVLGPIGLLLILFSYGGARCPNCKSNVYKKAEKCPKCDHEISTEKM